MFTTILIAVFDTWLGTVFIGVIHAKYPQVPAMGWPYVYLLLSILGGHTTPSDRAHLKAKDY